MKGNPDFWGIAKTMSRKESRVLAELRAHPHHDTPERLAALLGDDRNDVERSLTVLADRGLARHAMGHWQPTFRGWRLTSTG
mgnify:CR=1 FL=1